jgi:hypothetical protein
MSAGFYYHYPQGDGGRMPRRNLDKEDRKKPGDTVELYHDSIEMYEFTTQEIIDYLHHLFPHVPRERFNVQVGLVQVNRDEKSSLTTPL